jgi:hypothetical protein
METGTSIRAELSAISATDWAATPVSVQTLLLRLIDRMEEQAAQIVALQAEIVLLKAENATLREQVSRIRGIHHNRPRRTKALR